jgi:hypothetical protein
MQFEHAIAIVGPLTSSVGSHVPSCALDDLLGGEAVGVLGRAPDVGLSVIIALAAR